MSASRQQNGRVPACNVATPLAQLIPGVAEPTNTFCHAIIRIVSVVSGTPCATFYILRVLESVFK